MVTLILLAPASIEFYISSLRAMMKEIFTIDWPLNDLASSNFIDDVLWKFSDHDTAWL